MTPVSGFSCGENSVNCICPMSGDEAWIHCMKTTMNSLIDLHGKRKRSLDLKCRPYNFALSNIDETFLCDVDAQDVKCVGKSGKITTLFSTAPLIPILISLTRSGDLLVSMVDEDTYGRTSSSRRLVRRVTKTGTAIREYEYDNDGVTPLFTSPENTLELNNGNICIANKFGSRCSILYGFDNCGVLKFKYNGTGGEFNPLGMCCDRMGNIIISDWINKCVHYLDFEGNFIQFLLTEQALNFRPYAIALCKDRLWISSRDDGQVKVYSVLNH